MTPERFRQVEEVFQAVADAPAGEHAAVLDRLCGEDAELRAEVASLFAASPGASARIQGVIAREASEMTAAPRLFANRFEIEREAGSGGMGTVYRARDGSTGAVVALKLAHRAGVGGDTAERFAREARLLAEIAHPGIVAYVAHGEAPDGRLYLAMEWLDGEDLAARLSRDVLSLPECVELLRRAASALAVAHGRGVVHRDLKPSNLFLVGGAIGGVKVLDFGVARRMLTSRAMTQTGTLVGTPDYMAPEQARGAREIGPAADVFSLGCVLYECLTGEPPFVAEHITAVLARILFEDAAPVEQLRPGVPAPLSALLRRMLAKDPRQRPPHAGALVAELDALGEIAAGAAPLLNRRPRAPSVRATRERGAFSELGAALDAWGAPALAPSAFAEREQGLFSLVLAAPPALAADDPTVADRDDADRRSDVRSALAGLGLSADFMADGSLLVKVTGEGSAMDQAAHAARAAMVVRERWPAASVVVATGRGAVEGPFTVGEVAERAVRLLSVSGARNSDSRPGVRVDELSARLLGPRFTLAPSPDGAVLVGRERDVDVSRPLLGKPTPCVGREAELGSLEALFAGCVEESEARAVLVTAPPGVGKSRLRHELLRRIERRGPPVTLLAGRGDAMSAGAPYGVLAAAIRALAGVEVDAPPLEQQRLLHERVGRHVADADRERVVRFVGELCNVPFPDEGLAMLRAARHEPKIMGDCLRRAVLDFLAAECGAGPVLAVLDDLHWGDALTVSALDDALREQAGAPLFVLALARPEVHEAFPGLWHGNKVQEIVLRGLGRKACERLIRDVLGKDVPAAALDRAIDHSAGNALFLEEMIRALAEGKGDEQPETVLAMLQARIGRLDAGPRRALQAASVLGRTFWGGGVARVLGLTSVSAELAGWLATLIEAELVRPSPTSRLQGEKEYVFRHALVRDAAYGLLTAGDVATGHRLAGEFLEDAGEHDSAVVAEHFERCGALERAATFYLRAAEESLQRGDYTGARKVCERSYGCAPAGEVLGRLKSVEAYAGFFRSFGSSGEAAHVAMTLLRPGSLGWWRAIMAAVWADTGDPARMAEHLSLLDSTEPDEDLNTEIAHIDTMFITGSFLALAAPEPAVRGTLERLALHVEAVSERSPAARRYYSFCVGHAAMLRYPRPWSAMIDYRECLRLSQEAADRRQELLARVVAAEMGWLEMGDVDGPCERMLAFEKEISESQEGLIFTAWALYLVQILCEMRDEAAWAKAEDIAMRVRANLSGEFAVAFVPGMLVRVALLRGQLDKVEELFREATALLRMAPLIWMTCAPAHVQALIGLGRTVDACLAAEQVLGTLTALGGAGCFEVAARLAVTEAFEAAGHRDRAHTELAETLRQIQLRLDDIADPFWKSSYLTRNRGVARALSLADAWGLPPPRAS